MEQIIVIFKARSHTIKCYEVLKKNNIFAKIINTPKSAGVGCGLSLIMPANYYGAIYKIVKGLSLSSFVGIYKKQNLNGKEIIIPFTGNN